MSESENLNEKQEYIALRLRGLCELTCRRFSDELLGACLRQLEKYDLEVLKQAFNKAEIVFDRFTEFNKVREYCETIAGIQRSADRHVDEDCQMCRGTGWKVIPRPDGIGEMAVSCECRKAA